MKLFFVLILVIASIGLVTTPALSASGDEIKVKGVASLSKTELNRKLSGINCAYSGDSAIPSCSIDQIAADLAVSRKVGEIAKIKEPQLSVNVYGPSESVNDERWEILRDKLEGSGFNIDDYTLTAMPKDKKMNKVEIFVK